ncbi:phage holin family protein [Peribacillus tepidiphilus]|uniref:phage holin family protein n=1 Tax=Peribacillus tepidiphilus TaxID=2652445 RepID=UPI001291F3B2|nr:phage holin family protein [Peribacillus tepidiphilus]
MEIIKYISAGIGAGISFVFGGWHTLLSILLAFVILDYVSGFIAAGIEGKLNSSVGMKGIAKKVAVFFVVAVAHMMDVALGYDGHILRDATIFFFLANEALSILENVGRIGVPIPSALQKAVDILSDKSKGEDK